MRNSKYNIKITKYVIFFFAFIGIVLSGLLALVLFRPEMLEAVNLHEVSGELYTCMTYKTSAPIEETFGPGVNLKEAREIADAERGVDEYTQCLKDVFGHHTVWVNKNSYIIYD